MTGYAKRADNLGLLEQEMAEEWLRIVGTGVNGYEATKRVDLAYAHRHRIALAKYELALAKVRRVLPFP